MAWCQLPPSYATVRVQGLTHVNWRMRPVHVMPEKRNSCAPTCPVVDEVPDETQVSSSNEERKEARIHILSATP